MVWGRKTRPDSRRTASGSGKYLGTKAGQDGVALWWPRDGTRTSGGPEEELCLGPGHPFVLPSEGECLLQELPESSWLVAGAAAALGMSQISDWPVTISI